VRCHHKRAKIIKTGSEKQTMAEESSAGFSEQFKELVTQNEQRMKAIQEQIADQWEAQRKAITDQVEQQWNAQLKAITDLAERQWDAQKKAIQDAQNAIGGVFRPKPE
jgi:predicted  nucleic acid-binding Zn-ribbon protein